jgi:twitching motility protein PilT
VENSETTGGLQSVEPYLRALVDVGGSDLHCKTGSPPRVRIDGRLRKLQAGVLETEDTEFMVGEVLRERPDLMEEFQRTNGRTSRTPCRVSDGSA